MFVPVVLCAVTMFIFQIKRIISSEKWFNYVVTFLFLKMPKIWVDPTTLNGEKNEDGLRHVQLLASQFMCLSVQPVADRKASNMRKDPWRVAGDEDEG